MVESTNSNPPPEPENFPTVSDTSRSVPVQVFEWTGDLTELFKIELVNLFLQILTLGIYYFWAKTRVRNYIWSSTTALSSEDRIQYTGRGFELFWAFLRVVVPFVGLVALVEFVDLGMGVDAILSLAFLVVLVVGWDLGKWYGRRYLYSRTTWRGIRFGLTGRGFSYVIRHLAGRLLSTVTLGLLYPRYRHWVVDYVVNNTWFGDEKLEYDGTVSGMYDRYWVYWILSWFTFGLSWIWWYAREQRFIASRTTLQGRRFSMDHDGGDLFRLKLGNLLIMIVTLGLGGFWIRVRNARFVAEHLFVESEPEVETIAQSSEDVPSTGEGLIELFSGHIPMFGLMKL